MAMNGSITCASRYITRLATQHGGQRLHQYNRSMSMFRHMKSNDYINNGKPKEILLKDSSVDELASRLIVSRSFSSENKAEDSSATEAKAASEDEQKTSQKEEAAYSSVDEIRSAVLTAALNHVRELGFTKEAIAAGASDLSFSPMAHGLAEKSGPDLFIHLLLQMNAKTEAHLKHIKETSDPPLPPEKMVSEGLKHRLGQVVEWRDVFYQGLASLHTAPSVAPEALKVVTQLGDTIVHYSGDKSVGPQWYSSRASVIAVFKTAELVLLQDQSEGCQESMAFLDRRLDELHRGVISVEAVESVLKDSGKLLMAAFKTGMNIAGMNKFIK